MEKKTIKDKNVKNEIAIQENIRTENASNENKQYDILEFAQKNHEWIAVLCTGIGFIISSLISLHNYFYGRIFYDFYGLDFVLYEKNYSLLSNIFSAVTIGIVFYVGVFSIKYRNSFKKVKGKKCIKFLYGLIFPVVIDIFGAVLLSKTTLIGYLIIVIFIYFFQCKFAKFFPVKTETTKKKDIEFGIVDIIMIVVFLLLYSFGFNIYVKEELKNKKEYRVLDDTRVVVDVNKDFYITLNYEIKEDKMFIKRGTQELVENKNIESKLVKYEFIVE